MSNDTKIEGMHPLSYIEFIHKKDWEKLSDFINFYPDISHKLTNQNMETVKDYIKNYNSWRKNEKFKSGILQKICPKMNGRISRGRVLQEPIPNGYTLIKQILSRNQIDLNDWDDSITPLLIAIRDIKNPEVNRDVVKILIDYGADVNLGWYDGTTPLMLASKYSEQNEIIETVRLLIESGANLEAQDNFYGLTALITAVRPGQPPDATETIELLLKSGANVNAVSKPNVELGDCGSTTALESATGNESLDTLKLLIEYGADLNLRNLKGQTAMMSMTRYQTEYFTESLKYLIESGADVNLIDKNGSNPLMGLVTHKSSPEILEGVRMLIDEGGANIDAQNDYGCTALMYAVNTFDLSQYGEKSTSYNKYFCLKSSIQILNLLLKSGANINLVDEKGESALMAALKNARSHTLTVTKLLLENGANPNLVNKDSESVLMIALRYVKYSTTEVVKLLLEYGADPSLKTVKLIEETALDVAKKYTRVRDSQIFAEIEKLLTSQPPHL